MSQLLKPIMFGVLLLKFIVVGSLLTATLTLLEAAEVNAQTVSRENQTQRSWTMRTMRDVLPDVKLSRLPQRPSDQQTTQQIPYACRDNFSLGFAFVRAMYFAGLAHTDDATNEMAILQLVYLIDRLEDQPGEAAALQKALQMVVRRTGTERERSEAVRRVMALHTDAQRGEEQWYFKSGVSVSNLFVVTYLNDSLGIKSELQNLQSLTRIAPQSVPRNVLASMQKLVGYFAQPTFSEDDRAAVISTVESIIVTLA